MCQSSLARDARNIDEDRFFRWLQFDTAFFYLDFSRHAHKRKLAL